MSAIQLLSSKKTNYDLYNHNYINYDYTAINQLISINKPSNIKTSNSLNCFSSNILLLGATGFLGAHILDCFLSSSTGIAYCLVRSKDSLDEEERLRKILNFYFSEKYNSYLGNRIRIVHGDITLDNFGLSNEDYSRLGNSVEAVINSAALVKHYGNFIKNFITYLR